MSDRKRVRNDPHWAKNVMSVAAVEAISYLNAGLRHHYRGSGDTPSAARDRAAKAAGITSAQAQRLWKRWRTMSSVDGDVYRSLRNAYGHLCQKIEDSADAMRAERERLEANAVPEGPAAAAAGMEKAARRAAQ